MDKGMTDPTKTWLEQYNIGHEELIKLIDELAQGIKLINDMRDEIYKLADHNIPYYAYGDNQAAVEMSTRLEKIKGLCKRSIPEKPTA